MLFRADEFSVRIDLWSLDAMILYLSLLISLPSSSVGIHAKMVRMVRERSNIAIKVVLQKANPVATVRFLVWYGRGYAENGGRGDSHRWVSGRLG